MTVVIMVLRKCLFSLMSILNTVRYLFTDSRPHTKELGMQSDTVGVHASRYCVLLNWVRPRQVLMPGCFLE